MTLVNEMAKWRYKKQSKWDKGNPDYDLELTTVDSVILRLNWVPTIAGEWFSYAEKSSA